MNVEDQWKWKYRNGASGIVPVPIYSFRIRRSCVISWSKNQDRPCKIGIRQSTCRHHVGSTGLESPYIISWPPQQLLGIATAAQHVLVPSPPPHQTKYHKSKRNLLGHAGIRECSARNNLVAIRSLHSVITS